MSRIEKVKHKSHGTVGINSKHVLKGLSTEQYVIGSDEVQRF